MSDKKRWVVALAVAAGVAIGTGAVSAARGAAPPIKVIAKDFTFTPSTFTLRAGPTVFVITNTGTVEHSFVIDALKVRTPLIETGMTQKVTVNLKPGTYQAYCNVPGHKQIGMVATIVVK